MKVRDKLDNKRPDMSAILRHYKTHSSTLDVTINILHECTSNHICATRFLNSNIGTGWFKLLWLVYPYPGSGSRANVLILICYHEPKRPQPRPAQVLINGFPTRTGRTVYGSNASGVISEEGRRMPKRFLYKGIGFLICFCSGYSGFTFCRRGLRTVCNYLQARGNDE